MNAGESQHGQHFDFFVNPILSLDPHRAETGQDENDGVKGPTYQPMLPRTPAPGLRHRRTCWIEARGRRVRESQGIAKLARFQRTIGCKKGVDRSTEPRNRCDSAAGDMTWERDG